MSRSIASLLTLLTATLFSGLAVGALGTPTAGAVLPGANGAVIRSEKVAFLLDPLDATSLVRNAQRVLYRTTNRTGKAIAVSGTVLVPTTTWIGPGTRPVIGYAPGT